jgi:hypothetical protein
MIYLHGGSSFWKLFYYGDYQGCDGIEKWEDVGTMRMVIFFNLEDLVPHVFNEITKNIP